MVFKCLSLNLENKLPMSSCNRLLQGKVAIITGGARGIGASTAQLFQKNGAKVVIADVQDSLGQSLADQLGEGVTYVHCDVSNEVEIINLVDTAVSSYGKVDIMCINGCSSTFDSIFGSILDSAAKADLERVLAVDTVGGFLAAKHAARVMVPWRKGCILFTGSGFAEIEGLYNLGYSSVSTYGILGLVKSLESELGKKGIRVNCVSPCGLAGARMSAKGGLDPTITEQSIADSALYMVSDEASYLNYGYKFL